MDKRIDFRVLIWGKNTQIWNFRQRLLTSYSYMLCSSCSRLFPYILCYLEQAQGFSNRRIVVILFKDASRIIAIVSSILTSIVWAWGSEMTVLLLQIPPVYSSILVVVFSTMLLHFNHIWFRSSCRFEDDLDVVGGEKQIVKVT